MHISQVALENVKGFRDGPNGLTLNFARPDGSLPRWVVLAGRNGAGKSTLLQAVALTIAGPNMANKLQSSFADWIHEGRDVAKVAVRLRRGGDDHYPDDSGAVALAEPWVSMTWIRHPDGP